MTGDNENLGMRCPQCNCAWTEVTRTVKISNSRIKRYRQCHHCKYNFPTLETVNAPRKKKKKKKKPKADDDGFFVLDD